MPRRRIAIAIALFLILFLYFFLSLSSLELSRYHAEATFLMMQRRREKNMKRKNYIKNIKIRKASKSVKKILEKSFQLNQDGSYTKIRFRFINLKKKKVCIKEELSRGYNLYAIKKIIPCF